MKLNKNLMLLIILTILTSCSQDIIEDEITNKMKPITNMSRRNSNNTSITIDLLPKIYKYNDIVTRSLENRRISNYEIGLIEDQTSILKHSINEFMKKIRIVKNSSFTEDKRSQLTNRFFSINGGVNKLIYRVNKVLFSRRGIIFNLMNRIKRRDIDEIKILLNQSISDIKFVKRSLSVSPGNIMVPTFYIPGRSQTPSTYICGSTRKVEFYNNEYDYGDYFTLELSNPKGSFKNGVTELEKYIPFKTGLIQFDLLFDKKNIPLASSHYRFRVRLEKDDAYETYGDITKIGVYVFKDGREQSFVDSRGYPTAKTILTNKKPSAIIRQGNENISYNWYRNDTLILENGPHTLRVTKTGKYHASVAGGCHLNSTCYMFVTKEP